MSYILDALRRADSERERGSVPTLHTQPALADLADEAAATARSRRWIWGTAATGLLLLGAAALLWLLRENSPPNPAPPIPVAEKPLSPQPAAAVRMPPQRLPAPEPAAIAVPRAPAPVPTPAPQAKAQPAEPAAAERAVPRLSELPEGLRRELPALVTSGAMYSETPANRMLIINGQVFHEGDQVAAQLVLEQISLRGAVLSFKGQRFGISY
jgi:general secretion pathway protein B